MAWSDPGDFTSGQILTAAQMDSVREAMFFGQATFTNEAARDAAYGAPLSPITLQEGMTAYLSASTVATASGETTSIPSGITTIYNGTNWVCVTPVSARTTTVGSTTSTSYTTLTGGGTNPSVTLTTGTTAIVHISAWVANDNSATGNSVGVAVSGATTLAASADFCIYMDQSTAGYNTSLSFHYVISGLTAGANTFTLNYKTTSSTFRCKNRALTVIGIA